MADINLSQLINESLVAAEDDSAKEPGFLRKGLNRLQAFTQEHPTLTKGAKWAGGIGTVGGAAVIGKKLWDRHQANKSTLNQAKKQNDIEERKMKLEENKFEYEKEKDKYDVLIKEFKDNLDRLELELPNNISNININDEMVITDDEEN